MNARLLPWAIFAAAILGLAVRAVLPGKDGAEVARRAVPAAERRAEIRLGPVEVREFHDEGGWNRLTAKEAVYDYGRKTVTASEVVVSVGDGAALRGAVLRAPAASWNLDGKTIALPEGGRAVREGGWSGEISSATLDLAARILRAPGPASIAGPGFSVAGTNLAWRWADGRITMDAPKSRIAPPAHPRRKG